MDVHEYTVLAHFIKGYKYYLRMMGKSFREQLFLIHCIGSQ